MVSCKICILEGKWQSSVSPGQYNDIRKNTSLVVLLQANTPRLKGTKLNCLFLMDIWVLLIKFSRGFAFFFGFHLLFLFPFYLIEASQLFSCTL